MRTTTTKMRVPNENKRQILQIQYMYYPLVMTEFLLKHHFIAFNPDDTVRFHVKRWTQLIKHWNTYDINIWDAAGAGYHLQSPWCVLTATCFEQQWLLSRVGWLSHQMHLTAQSPALHHRMTGQSAEGKENSHVGYHFGHTYICSTTSSLSITQGNFIV